MIGCGRCCQTEERHDLGRRKKDLENARRQSLLDYLERLRCAPVKEMERIGCCENQVAKVRRSKKSVRRSSALIKPGRTSTVNSPVKRDVKPGFSQSRMNLVLRGCKAGSILRGQTSDLETQASRSHSRSSLHAFSSTKGSRNWRTNTRRKFPPLTEISSAGHPLQRHKTSRSCCCCLNTRSKNSTPSTSDEESIDYQVPIEPSMSSHTCYETGSGSRTLVPTSSHVTIRICSKESSSSLSCDECHHEHESPCLSESEDSSNHLEERVRKCLRGVCCCEDAGNRFSRSKFSCSRGCQTFSTHQNSSRTSRFGPKSELRCYTCGDSLAPASDLVGSSDEGSFRRFKDVLVESKRRKGTTSVPKCGPTTKKTMVKHHLQDRSPSPNPTIILSAKQYKKFNERCEGIRRSMKTDESVREAPVWKGPGLNLSDFRPDLPPLDHWSQYEAGMKKVANEYRTLKSCVSLIESEAKKPGCCCREKSITRTYPSGTEFTFNVKRAKNKGEEDCCPSAEEELLNKCEEVEHGKIQRSTGRSVCFEKNKTEDLEDLGVPRDEDESNVDAMKAREADLVKTLETFCEKMKSMKSEFEKSSTPGCLQGKKNCGRIRCRKKNCNKMKPKKLVIFPPDGENGPPLTLYKNSSSINCRVKGDREIGFRYDVTYVQRFVSSSWNPDKDCQRGVDSG